MFASPFLFLWLILGFCIPKWSMKLTEYQITSSKISVPLRIVELSDLHNADLGEKLPQLVAEQKPDLILFVGDLVDMDRSDRDRALSTIRTLADIAPVYVSMGNHDIVHEYNYSVDLESAFEEAGATVLDFSYEDIIDLQAAAITLYIDRIWLITGRRCLDIDSPASV